MIEKGYPTEEIVSLVSGYTKNKVDTLRKKMQNEKDASGQADPHQ